MKTETGKLMSSGRVGFSGRRTEVDSYYPVTHEDWIVLRDRIEQLEGTIVEQYSQPAYFTTLSKEVDFLQSKMDDLHDTCVQQQELLDNLHQQSLRILSILLSPRHSEALKELLAHPDNLANLVHSDHEQGQKG